ncbi:uncharacterized protein LOC135493960 [Lineus longissimus]|uniref:uncharacterized protein LOC135493960 n=1 Tax=Lineus longissimus TaxID=88925 RepID=UPI00315D61DD
MDRHATSLALEQKYVYKVYDSIAPYFSHTRHKAWPKVAEFLENLPAGSLVADVGCGNGRYFDVNKSIFKFGSDRCQKLVEAARNDRHEVMSCDNLQLPYRNNVFDAVISIGVIHHFATVERRVAALRELARIIQPGGRIMVYVWAMEQTRRKFDAQDVLVPWNMQTKHMRRRGKLLLDKKDSCNHSTSSLSEDEFDNTILGFPKHCDSVEVMKEKEKICQDIVSLVAMSGADEAVEQTWCSKCSGLQTDVLQLGGSGYKSKKLRSIPPNIQLRSPSNPSPSDIQAIATEANLNFEHAEKKKKKRSIMTMVRGSGHVSGTPSSDSTPTRLPSDNTQESSCEQERKMSLPDRLKANFINLLSPSKSSKKGSRHEKGQKGEENQDEKKDVKDHLYKELIDHIAKNESHIFDKPWPPIDSPTLMPDAARGQSFQVREFPQSSRPLLRQESTESALSFLHSRRNTEKGHTSSADFASDEQNSSMSDDEASDEVFAAVTMTTEKQSSHQSKKKSKEDGDGKDETKNKHRKLTLSKSVPATVATNDNKTNGIPASGNIECSHIRSGIFEKVTEPDSLTRRSSMDQQSAVDLRRESLKSFRGRIFSDPTYNEGVKKDQLSIPGPGGELRERDGYSADESSIDSSMIDLCSINSSHFLKSESLSRTNSEEKPERPLNGFSYPPPLMDPVEEKGSTEQSEKEQLSPDEHCDMLPKLKHKKLHTIEQRRKLKRHSFELQALRRHLDNMPHVDQSRRSLPVVSTQRRFVANGCVPELSMMTSVDATSTESLLDQRIETDSESTEPGPKSPTYHRYYHVFKDGELNGLITKYVPGLNVVDTYYDHANWCVVAEKACPSS